MEEAEVKNIFGKRAIMQDEDYIVLDEAQNSIIYLDVEI